MSDASELPLDDQDALVALLLQEQGFTTAADRGIRPRPPGAAAPLSAQQRRMWFLHQLDPVNASYVIPGVVRVTGRLDVALLQGAVDALVRRHETLRTTFVEHDGVPRQAIRAHQHVDVGVEDIAAFEPDAREAHLRAGVAEALALPFDLASGPLLRVVVFRLSSDAHVVLLAVHHIVSDGWSAGVMISELAALYAAGAEGPADALAPLAVQYADFAVWQEAWRETPAAAAQLAYWRRQLADLPQLELPTDRPRPDVLARRGGSVRATLDASTTAALRDLGNACGATLFMTLVSGFAALLHRYTSQEDVAIGTPSANRNRAELEPLIGFFVNALVLRADLSGRPSLRTLITRTRQVALDAWANQDVPFEDVVEAVQPDRTPNQNPLFQVMLVLQNAPAGELKVAGLTFEPDDAPATVAKFDLTLYVVETGAELSLLLEYNADLFDEATAQQMLTHYTRILSLGLADPDLPISDLELLSPVEQHQVLVDWNETAAAYPRHSTIHDVFREQAARTPHNVALRFGATEMTYAELERRANQLAHCLRGRGASPGTVIGLLAERSLEAFVGLLGILKSGAAYLPLDPAYPVERLELLLRDAAVTIVVAQTSLAAAVPHGELDVVTLDASWDMVAGQPSEPLRNPHAIAPPPAKGSREIVREAGSGTRDATNEAGPLDLAYVMFTSGSTGTPKGVAIPHRAVLRLVLGSDYVRFAGETMLQFAPLTFDASTFEIWGALLNGGTLAIMEPGTPSLADLGRAMTDAGVTTAWLTAGLFHQMVDHELPAVARLRQLVAGGDVLSVRHVRALLERAPHLRLVNGFGPTETTTFACCHAMSGIADAAALGATVPIGQPIANSRAFILDAQLAPAPVGVAGDLYLGGDGLARGYLGQPGLTAERFIPNPFAIEPGERLYRTGDRARWRRDGTIEFLGRRDRQVKIRGFRVEAGEIEAALTALDAVRACVVVAAQDGGERELVAYVAADAGPATSFEALRAALRARLPEYMLPSRFVRLDALPLTANGKVDAKALPPPGAVERERQVTAPRTADEIAVAQIWAEVLRVDRVGVDDDFFALGGHSLLATQVVARLRDRLGVDVPLAAVFAGPTVAALAGEVAGARAAGSASAPALQSIPRSNARRLKQGGVLAAQGASAASRRDPDGARAGSDH